MGFLSGLMGNASEVDLEKLSEDLSPILGEGEAITMGYKVVRDMFVFTNKRMILIDKQGMTGKKTEYLSIPYKSITSFSVETAGHFDMEAELIVWISGRSEPIMRELKKGTDVVGIQKMIATYALK
ncbi:PH domain-containing protein [Pleionea sp. CnH1-48]|uniref:PH domain-containing protein n=1 Tax=Pleionea sp. CnH1-48 TaxID=2954494 RepID=UPI0020968EBF|nr:PH domain-containing protein [Pleionea sp. CnH1-48]MCO7227154.1 PH domain-containing protein [Pleionea sp. CnH1-48]